MFDTFIFIFQFSNTFVSRVNREFFRRKTSTNHAFCFFNFCLWQAIICGKIGQSPVQKILRNGKSVTTFTVGTGGMFDQRITDKDLPKPAQWHRIAVHNEVLGAYAVKQLVKKYGSRPFNLKYYTFCVKLIINLLYSSPVYVEGDIETRVYNDSISGEVKSIPEICVRRDGMFGIYI